MIVARGLAAFGLLLALAGCWTGEAFYTAAEARPAIAPGDYATTSMTPEDTGRVRVSRRADGFTLFTPIRADGSRNEGDAVAVGFAPLGGGLFVAWLGEADSHAFANIVRPYGLLAPAGEGGWRLVVPACDATESLARGAGARVANDGQTETCHFATRAALEAALRQLASRDDPAIRLMPWTGR